MSWFHCAQKSMPLPFGTSPTNIGGDKVRARMTEDQAKSEEEFHPDLEWLGEGTEGIAFTTRGLALKYTTGSEEAEAARHVWHNPCPCIVRIHAVREVQPAHHYPVYAIVMDQLKELKQDEKTWLGKLASALDTHHYSATYRYKNRVNPEYQPMTFEQVIEQLSKPVAWLEPKPTPALMPFLQEVYAFCICLINSGFFLTDVTGRNVGRDSQGQLRLFDLGGSWIDKSSYQQMNWLQKSGARWPPPSGGPSNPQAFADWKHQQEFAKDWERKIWQGKEGPNPTIPSGSKNAQFPVYMTDINEKEQTIGFGGSVAAYKWNAPNEPWWVLYDGKEEQDSGMEVSMKEFYDFYWETLRVVNAKFVKNLVMYGEQIKGKKNPSLYQAMVAAAGQRIEL